MRAAAWQRAAQGVSTLGIAAVFVIFLYGVVMRYFFNQPQSWVDETVTLLTAWTVLWTSAFVIRWPDHIAFDVLFINLTPGIQRAVLLISCVGFIALMGYAMPTIVDYTLFLKIERTDMLQLRLDLVYSIFSVFLAVVLARLSWTVWRLMGAQWNRELECWAHEPEEERA